MTRLRSRPAGRRVIRPEPDPIVLERPVLIDTGVWTWVRDRRFPHLAAWFNDQVAAGRVLVCDIVVLELVRLTPNAQRATALAERLAAFASVAAPGDAGSLARDLQLELAAAGTHRSVPPVDLLMAVTAETSGIELVHYDRDYERIGQVSGLTHRWFVPDGSLA